MKPFSKITIKDVAQKANVSIATVSNVMNGSGRVSPETYRKVKLIIEELNFTPSNAARNLKDKSSHLIAVIVPVAEKTGRLEDNPFYWQLVSGIEAGARDHELHVMLHAVHDEETFSFVQDRYLDGLIVVGANNNSPFVERILSLQVPCVFMDSYLEDPDLHQILLDDETGSYLGTKHLLSLGHEKIALLCGNLDSSGVTHQRWLGYKRALKEAGLPYDLEMILEGPVSLKGGYQLAQKVSDARNGISAAFAFSDVGAMGLIKGLHDLGVSVPRDISVVGFDDLSYVSYMIPSLTTVSQDISGRGTAAVKLLFQQLEKGGGEVKRKMVLPVELKVRQSTLPFNRP